jgi:hypothetical protein
MHSAVLQALLIRLQVQHSASRKKLWQCTHFCAPHIRASQLFSARVPVAHGQAGGQCGPRSRGVHILYIKIYIYTKIYTFYMYIYLKK